MVFGLAVLLALGLAPAPALAQQDASPATRDQVLSVLKSAAQAGRADAQLALANLLDPGHGQRNEEALAWYERAARAGNPVAQRRYLAMMSRPAAAAAPAEPAASAPAPALRSFIMRVPQGSFDEDDMPPDVPPGFHCHPLGGGRAWCHGGSDG